MSRDIQAVFHFVCKEDDSVFPFLIWLSFQMQESLQLLMVEKEDLEQDYKFAKQTILTLNAKL